MYFLRSTLLLMVSCLLLTIVLCSITATAHRCIHGESAFQSHLISNMRQAPQVHYQSEISNPSTFNPKENEPHLKRKTSGVTHSKHIGAAWEPIRIVVDQSHLSDASKICTAVGQARPDFLGSTYTCTADDILTVEKLWVITRLAVPLAVQRVRQMFNVAPITGPLVVPADACGAGMVIPPAHTSPGVAGADFIIYALSAGLGAASGRVPKESPRTIAWAGYCAVDQSGRPIVGRLNFVPALIAWRASGWAFDTYVRVIVHELFHSLGFTTVMLNKMANTTMRRGKKVTIVTAPLVMEAARLHLDCAALNGVELEDEGGGGTAQTHWERRQWMDEVMAGVASRAAVSSLSLAFFASLGFYRMNMGYSEPMLWGRDAGCKFVEMPCTTASPRMGIEWCNQESTKQICTSDYTSVGFCNLGYVKFLPVYFRYFANDPTLGGLSPLMDHCPVVTPYMNRQCQNPSSAEESDHIYGSYFGEQSRCVSTRYMVRAGYTTVDTSPRCLRVRCPRGTRAEVLVGDDWLECPTDGSAGDISIPYRTGFKGTIHCAPASRICTPELYNPSDDQAPLREYALDVILVLHATDAVENARLANVAAHSPGDFLLHVTSDFSRLCNCGFGAGAARLLPEIATAAASSHGGVLVYAQLGLTTRGGAVAVERHRFLLESRLAAGSAMPTVGATVRIAAAEILPEGGVVDATTSLSQVASVADATMQCAGESLAGMSALDAVTIERFSTAAQQDLSKALYVTANLIHVRQVRMMDPATLSIDFIVYFPPSSGVNSVDNATVIIEMWRGQLNALVNIAGALPVLSSAAQQLLQGVPISVMNSAKAAGLTIQFVEVQQAQPRTDKVSQCVVEFNGCFIVQILVLAVVVLLIVVLIAQGVRCMLYPSSIKDSDVYYELQVPPQPYRVRGMNRI